MYYVSNKKGSAYPDVNAYEFEDSELELAQAKAISMAETHPNTEWHVHLAVTEVKTVFRTVFRAIGRVTTESETIDPPDPS